MEIELKPNIKNKIIALRVQQDVLQQRINEIVDVVLEMEGVESKDLLIDFSQDHGKIIILEKE